MATEAIKPYYIDENGVFCVNACCDAANSDWIRSARLKKEVDKGNTKAGAKLERLENTAMLEDNGDSDSR